MKTPDPTKAGSSARNGIESSAAPTKEEEVLRALYVGSLNRFEAERIGDHCLNSTIAQLRGKGVQLVDEWEKVPSRGSRGFTRVKRYWVKSEPGNLERVRRMLEMSQRGE
ncbi:hypothetical protein [Acidovorax temperans]|uniref:hypothetical protein n=1 Tax=Acidovorax temperans TaxID=80878 RepID=UPI0035B26C1F